MKNIETTIDAMKYTEDGLIPAVCVDEKSGRVLTVAYMNRDSFADTVKTGKTHFWSRSREKYWMKGESSGHTQEVVDIYTDCDMDTLVIVVRQNVAACHNGYFSCFYRKLDETGAWKVVDEKVFDPDKVY